MVAAKVLVLILLAIAEGEKFHQEVRERQGHADLRLGELPIGAIPGDCQRSRGLVDVNGFFHGVGVKLDGTDGPRGRL